MTYISIPQFITEGSQGRNVNCVCIYHNKWKSWLGIYMGFQRKAPNRAKVGIRVLHGSERLSETHFKDSYALGEF